MFSLDVDATAAALATNYAVKDAGAALAVSAAALATGKTDTVWLTTAAQTADKEYINCKRRENKDRRQSS